MRTKLVITGLTGLFILSCSHAFAQTNNPLSQVFACKNITESAQRLACYDVNVEQLQNAQNTGELVAIDREAAEEIEKDSFGLNIPSLPKLKIFGKSDDDKNNSASKNQSFAIKSVSKRPNGYLRFELENGQIWVQTQAPSVRFRSTADPDMLIIKKASLGSYRARINGKGRGIRVKRVE